MNRIAEILKDLCYEAQNNDRSYIEPLVFRASVKIDSLIKEISKEAYDKGRQSVLDEWKEEKDKLLQGFSYKRKLGAK